MGNARGWSRWAGIILLLLQTGSARAGNQWSEEACAGKEPAGRVEARIEEGWLHAVRLDVTGEVVWHVVLGRIAPGESPVVTTDKASGEVEVRHPNGRFYVRESGSRLSCVRERLVWGAFAGLDTTFLKGAEVGGSASGGTGNTVGMTARRLNGWDWVVLGAAKVRDLEPADLESGPDWTMDLQPTGLVRITPTLAAEGVRYSADAGGVIYDRGTARLIDDGEQLEAHLVTLQEAMRLRPRRAKAAPTEQ